MIMHRYGPYWHNESKKYVVETSIGEKFARSTFDTLPTAFEVVLTRRKHKLWLDDSISAVTGEPYDGNHSK